MKVQAGGFNITVQRFTIELGGRPMTLETGHVARQAGGSVLVHYGETVVLVTATASQTPREGIDFFPLTVDYEERLYAAGRIPGNWFRREGRPTSKAILAARLIDRPIRPLFPDGFRNEVQIIATVLAVDGENPPEMAAMVGASAALAISDIPFLGPIGAVTIGLVNGEFVVNPTATQEEDSILHLVVAGTRDAILMVEAGADEVPEAQMLDAMALAQEEIARICDFIADIQQQVGKPKREFTLATFDPELEQAVRDLATDKLRGVLGTVDKQEREAAINAVNEEVKEALQEQFPEQERQIGNVLKEVLKELVRQAIVNEGKRPDGRRPDEIRPIDCRVGLLARTHGTGLFTRGQTQVLTVATLGSIRDMQELDDLSGEETKRYLHHYNFPPYSVGETRFMRAPGRREIGHGALAERALEPMIPPESEFPYTIRLVSEVLESNGSSSMASVCGSTLALMDAGVPIKKPVAGIAMGLVKEGDKAQVLTDIQGMEDFLGDMDFKVAGTKDGITALQMDMKALGVDRPLLERALEQARQSRLFILDKMLEAIPAPRPELSPHAPRMIIMRIDPEKIADVIGKKGATINKIVEDTRVGRHKVDISIEDDGTIYIASVNEEAGRSAQQMIEQLVRDPAVGEVFTGKVKRIMNFGAFVEILPNKEGMVHISELAEERIERVEDAVNIGDEITVMVTEIDHMGRINLSRREVLRREKGLPPSPHGGRVSDRPRGGGGGRPGGSRGGPGGGPRPGGPRPSGPPRQR